jgi:hypothetical protein
MRDHSPLPLPSGHKWKRVSVRAYVDDIFVASDDVPEHLTDVHLVLYILASYGIYLKPAKAYVGFPSLLMLGAYVDQLGMTTRDERLQAILSLEFLKTCQELETYLGMTGSFRAFIDHYAAKAEPLHFRKTALLRGSPLAGAPQRRYAKATRLADPTEEEIAAFETLQREFRHTR